MDASEEHDPCTDRPAGADDLSEALERLGAVLVQVAETVVGLGVLGVNRVQALRRDLAARAEHRSSDPDGDAG